jgi:uncharacterized membrane protein YkvA (DUF1232 family)
MKNSIGKVNIGTGLLVMAGFMVYGFFLIYMRDFHPNKEAWIAASHIGEHFESRLAHVHGNLFSVLNIVFGYLILTLPIAPSYAKWVSRLALAGLLMPIGILAEVYLGVPFYLVLVGAISIVSATVLLGIAVLSMKKDEASN